MSEEAVVGTFRLLEQVGRGGMGVVWRAEHLQHAVPAALKFVTNKRAFDPRYRAQFRNEVETIAALDHPSVARVFDHGVAPARLAAQQIAEGSPYLAMEWAPGGTLADLVPIPSWERVRDIVLDILHGLAHAHARGIVHRDLKPQNVLVGDAGRLKLSDFGLAFRSAPGEPSKGFAANSGSPRWMAPEQIRGSFRDQGPWTDVYGVGCLVFWLLTYRPPYHAGSVDEILRGHLEGPIPRLKSRIAVPHDIESWLRRLLAKDPSDRYRFAADAAHDLLQFSEELSVPIDDRELANPHDVDTMPEDLLEAELFGEEPSGLDEPSSYSLYETSAMPIRLERRPLPPRSWVRADVPDTPMPLIAAGLGLWGLRAVPIVGRETERDVLWSALRTVHRESRPTVVVLRGAAGTGKTRLAQWLGERAVELGAAHVVRATHDSLGAAQDGLGGAVAAWFRAFGIDSLAMQARIRTEFEALSHTDEHLDAQALSEMIEAATTSKIAATADARERWWDAWLRYVERATQDRTMLLVMDDLQWGAQSLGFVAQVLQDAPRIRLLFVLTVREDALVERPVERTRLAGLLEQDDVTEVVIGPLAAEHQLELVTRLLHLGPTLAADVVERSAGNPLFAVQLTDDWVQRGLLEVAESGFVLAKGASADLPDELRLVWSSRLERFLATHEGDAGARSAIEIGAALGHAPSDAEWRQVCERAGLDPLPELVDDLARNGLVTRRSGRWAFCHAMFREAIEATARIEGRGERWHSLCADYLEETFGSAPEVAERHAGHLVAAARHDDALPQILAAAEAHARTGEFDRVASMFEWYDATLELVERDTTVDEVRGELHRVRNSLFESDVDDMESRLVVAEARIDGLEDPGLHAEALFVRSRLHRHRGEPEAAVTPAETALALLRDLDGVDSQLALVLRSLGELYRSLGQLKDAKKSYAEARKLFGELGDDFQLGWCEFGLATTAKQAGEKRAYVKHFEAAAAAFENSRSYGALGCAYNEKGEWLRAQARYDEALDVYASSLQILPRSHSEVGVAQFNLGLTYIAQDKWGLGQEWLQRARTSFEQHRRVGALAYIDLADLVCAAADEQWGRVETLLKGVLPVIEERRLTNQDVASLLMRAGDLCREGGEFKRAAQLWELSRLHWERLGRDEEVAQIDERLSAA